MLFLMMFPHNPSHGHFQPPFNLKTPTGLTLFWPTVPLSSLTPDTFLLAPIGGEGSYRRLGLKMGERQRDGVSSDREEHLFRKSIKEAGIDLGF